MGVVPATTSTQYGAWKALYQLTLPSKQSFEMAASLRSEKFHDWELYSFYRLSQRLEEQAMKFWNFAKPK